MEELAFAYWRLAKWVEAADVEHKMAATSALRQVKKFLDENNIEIVDYTGQKFDSGYAIDVLGRKSGEDLPEEELVIVETVRPIILEEGEVVKYGQAFLGVSTSAVEPSAPAFSVGKTKAISRYIDAYCEAPEHNKLTAWLLKTSKARLEKDYLAKENN